MLAMLPTLFGLGIAGCRVSNSSGSTTQVSGAGNETSLSGRTTEAVRETLVKVSQQILDALAAGDRDFIQKYASRSSQFPEVAEFEGLKGFGRFTCAVVPNLGEGHYGANGQVVYTSTDHIGSCSTSSGSEGTPGYASAGWTLTVSKDGKLLEFHDVVLYRGP